jgi:hypothetical protein
VVMIDLMMIDLHKLPQLAMPLPGEIWRHYKGTLYEILFISYDEESGFPRVQYREAGGTTVMIHGRLLHVFLGYAETHEKRFTFDRSSW